MKPTFAHSPILVVVLFLAALIAALGISRFSYSNDAQAQSIKPVTVELLGEQPQSLAANSERYIARVEAAQRVELGFDIASTLTKLYKREGERFKKGELLAQLDASRLQAKQSELDASQDRAQAMLALADTSLKRIKGLHVKGNASAQALDEAIRQRDAASADLSLVKAQRKSIEIELNKSKLFAPFDGVVVTRMSDLGRTVSLGLPVFVVEQSGQPEVRVSLPLAVAKNLGEGERVSLYAKSEVFDARIERISLSLSSKRVSELYLALEDSAASLVPGELLQLALPNSEAEQGLWLPLSALAEYGRGLWSVYLAKPGQGDIRELSRAVVQIDAVRGEWAKVRGGLSAELRPYVVKQGTHRIVAGQQVQVFDAEQVSRAH